MKRVYIFLFLLMCVNFSFAAQRQMESLSRGVVAVKVGSGVYVSWRFLGTDSKSDGFNVYRDGTLLNSSPITTKTNYTDAGGSSSSSYVVKKVSNGVETESSLAVTPWASFQKSIQLKRPAAGSNKSGSYTYTSNDMSVGDVDGDGEYELIVKWDPSNSKDNSQKGYTGNVFLDCYKLDGTFLWRIDLGVNIRAGAHYTQFQVYDYDGDGKAEVACKTAPGTKDGKGNYVLMNSDDPSKDYRNSNGYVLSGSEYLTMFNGETGAEMSTVAYNPARGTVSSWGDSYGNRCDRFLACTAYLDGVHPSLVVCRGYYTRSALTAYDFKNGKLVQRWYHNSASKGSGAYAEGFHNVSVADVDKDGYDEIIYGSATIDHDGSLYSRTGYGHGDAMHVSKMVAGDDDFYGWFVHEETSSAYGYELRNLRTNKVKFGLKTGTDNGRGCAADIDPNNAGFECWSTYDGNVYNTSGTSVGSRYSVNFRIYWDGDLQDELLDGTKISKFNTSSKKMADVIDFSSYDNSASCNTSKATPCLSADLFGDWREEVIFYNSSDPSKINIFTTTTPTEYRLFTPMHDPVYRMGIAWQNTSYNQPPHLGIYIGDGINKVSQPDIYTVGDVSVGDPALEKKGAGSSSQTVALGTNIADFSYEWSHASTVKISWEPFVPEGLTINIDQSSKNIYFGGTSSILGTYKYTVTTVSGAVEEVSKSGTLTFGDGTFPSATLTKQGGGSSNQTLTSENSFVNFNYAWNYASTVEVTWEPSMPEGITIFVSNDEKKIYFSGTPTGCGTYGFTVTTVGNPTVVTKKGTVTIASEVYVYQYDEEVADADWDNTNNWLPNGEPTDCDTAIVRTGEVNINSDIRAITFVESDGTFRIRNNVAVRELHIQGGTLKSYTSTPQFRMTVNNMYIEEASTFMCGSTPASEFLINGNMSGTGDITKTRTGLLTLNINASDYSGFWYLQDGQIGLSRADALGTGGISISDTAVLNVNVAASTGSLNMVETATINLVADFTVNTATLGSHKLAAGTYSASDFPEYLTGSANLIVLEGESTTDQMVIKGGSTLVKVVPNPVEDWAEVLISSSFSETGKLTLMDINGSEYSTQEIALQSGLNRINMDFSEYNSGVYFLRITTENRVEMSKIIIR